MLGPAVPGIRKTALNKSLFLWESPFQEQLKEEFSLVVQSVSAINEHVSVSLFLQYC